MYRVRHMLRIGKIRDTITQIALTASIFLLFAASYVLFDLYGSMKKRQEIVNDLAVVNDVRYGLFNVEKWKVIIANVISQKIHEFEIGSNMRENLRAPVENALYKLIDNVEEFMNQENASGNRIQQTVRTFAFNLFFDVEKFKEQVPGWADEVLNQLDAPENRNQIAVFLQEKLDAFFDETVTLNNYDINSYITSKYEIDDYEECVALLAEKSSDLTARSWRLSWLLISLVFVMFLVYFGIASQCRTEMHYYALLLGAVVLLLGGILTPIIDIDARISDFEFLFLGETVRFKDQVIFFQSKSIFDVVSLLIKEGDAQTIGVGMLIFTFSIIFPSIKLTLSALAYRFPKIISENRILNFFVLESAKWSMADVMVIAIFMSYIGFSSLVGAQLEHFSNFDNARLLSTHRHTTLQMGFFIFTAYCMSGIAFGYAAKKLLFINCKIDFAKTSVRVNPCPS